MPHTITIRGRQYTVVSQSSIGYELRGRRGAVMLLTRNLQSGLLYAHDHRQIFPEPFRDDGGEIRPAY